MRCPSCDEALLPGSHEGVPVHGCTACGGRFLDFPALKSALASEDRPRSDLERAGAMASSGTAATVTPDERDVHPCPVCRVPMRRYVHQYSSGVWVDSCEVHGVWLDAGELERLEAYAESVARGGTAPVAPTKVGLTTPRVATSEDAVFGRLQGEYRDTSGAFSFLDMLTGGGWDPF